MLGGLALLTDASQVLKSKDKKSIEDMVNRSIASRVNKAKITQRQLDYKKRIMSEINKMSVPEIYNQLKSVNVNLPEDLISKLKRPVMRQLLLEAGSRAIERGTVDYGETVDVDV